MANKNFQNSKNSRYGKKAGSKQYGKSSSSSKGKKKPSFEEAEDKKSYGDINDASYYYGDANVLNQVMNFSFNEFGGVITNMDVDYHHTEGKIYNSMVATYWLNPAIPRADKSRATVWNEGINVASLRNYLLLSGSNAKTTLYAPQDVTILILALAEVIKVATFIARAFGVAYLFNYRNRSYPETLLTAMGIDPADYKNNLANNRIRFNKALAVASKIPFPADVPIFKKASELYANIYLDDPSSALAQTYMFVPFSVWKFNEAYDTNGAGLDTFKIVNPSTLTPLNTIIANFEQMVSALVTSSSLNSIYSDIMRLVQNGKFNSLITFNSIPEDFMVVPVFNEEVKTWIHNATIIGEPDDTATYDENTPKNDVSCSAENNNVVYSPQWHVPNSGGYDFLLDFDHDNVTVDERVMATRLSTRWAAAQIGTETAWTTLGFAVLDEYVVKATFYTGTHDYADLTIDNSFVAPTTIANTIWLADVVSKFDWAPLLYYIGTNNNVRVLGDLDYYTTVDQDVLTKIYDYEILHFIQIG